MDGRLTVVETNLPTFFVFLLPLSLGLQLFAAPYLSFAVVPGQHEAPAVLSYLLMVGVTISCECSFNPLVTSSGSIARLIKLLLFFSAPLLALQVILTSSLGLRLVGLNPPSSNHPRLSIVNSPPHKSSPKPDAKGLTRLRELRYRKPSGEGHQIRDSEPISGDGFEETNGYDIGYQHSNLSDQDRTRYLPGAFSTSTSLKSPNRYQNSSKRTSRGYEMISAPSELRSGSPSVAYDSSQWNGNINTNGQIKPRSALVRGLNLVWNPNPRLEVLPPRFQVQR